MAAPSDAAFSGFAPARRFAVARHGVAAVEFALIAPVLIVMIFGIYAASFMMATINGLEQLTAGAARSAAGGLSDTERASLVSAYMSANAGYYPYIDATKLQVSTASNAATQSFSVTTSYDLSTNGLFAALKTLVPAMQPVITRSATIQQGGY